MSEASISTVFQDLFQAPLKAVTDAEARYRAIWADWIQMQYDLAFDKTKNDWRAGVDFSKVMQTAPVISLDGVIEVGITMRIASVREISANLNIGISVGPIYASGGFGFMNRTTQESVFQASTRFTLSNQNKDLSCGAPQKSDQWLS